MKKIVCSIMFLVIVALFCHAQLTVFPSGGGGSGSTTVAGLSDSGTAAYSNANAFALSGTVQTNWPVSAVTNAGTAAYSNATAFAAAQSGTIVTQNNSFAVVVSNAWKMDAAHSLSLSNLTASRVVLSGADNGLSSAAASGAVPIDSDGSATTFAQVNALASANIVTQNNSFSLVLSNAVKMDAAHSLSLSNLTASRVTLSGADKSLSSAAASGAVPINADGSATVWSQISALAPQQTNLLSSADTLIYWRMAVDKILQNSNTLQAVVEVLSDSWGATNLYVDQLGKALKREYGDAGDGFQCASIFNNLHWHGPKTYLFWTNNGDAGFAYNQDTLDINTLSGNSSVFVTNYCKSMGLFWRDHFGGAGTGFTIKTNGATWRTIGTTAGFFYTNIVFPVQATNFIELQYTAGNVNNQLYGICFQNTNTGVRVDNVGKIGMSYSSGIGESDWFFNSYIHSSLAPNLVTIDLGQNDIDSSGCNCPTLLASNAQVVINFMVTNLPTASVAVVARCDVAITNSGTSMRNVESVLRAVSATNNVAYIDTYHSMLSYSPGNTAGEYDGTSKHLTFYGYGVYANMIHRGIMGYPIHPPNSLSPYATPALISPGGIRYRITVNDAGTILTTAEPSYGP